MFSVNPQRPEKTITELFIRYLTGFFPVLIVTLSLCVPVGAQAGETRTVEGENGAVITFSDRPGGVVVELRRYVGFRGETEEPPLVRVYGDGLVAVHFPLYHKQAGDYTLRLSPAELDDLIGSLADDGILDFDPLRVRAEQRAAESLRTLQTATGEAEIVTVVMDDTVTEIDVNLETYRPGDPSEPVRRNVRQRLSWKGVRTDAGRYPGVASLQGLARSEVRLVGLSRDARLERVR